MADKDYYGTLGVDKNADEAAIKRAYRSLAKKYHPDMNPGDAEAEQKFKEVNEAYSVLSDPEKKAKYDQFGSAAFDGTGGFNPHFKLHNNRQYNVSFALKGDGAADRSIYVLARYDEGGALECAAFLDENMMLIPVPLEVVKNFSEGGGGLFADSTELTALYNGGMRILGLCWDSNELATGAWDRSGGGLTSEGRKLALACEEIGITLDCSHLNDRSLDELMDITRYPVIATHSNFRSVCNSPRNLTDEQAKKIISRGGVIGLNLYPEFVKERDAKIEDILPHIDYHLEHFGDTGLGFGFDIDGTDGNYPKGINPEVSIHDQVVEILLKHYPESTVRKIAGENVLDFLKGVL